MQPIKDGIYYGNGLGHDEEIKVAVEIKANMIKSVNVLNREETNNLANQAINKTTQEIVETQSFMVDVVSGASETSKGILKATEEALKTIPDINIGNFIDYRHKKSNDFFKIKNKNLNEEKIVWKNESDVVIIGGGAAGLSAAIEAAQNNSSVYVVEYNASYLASNTALCGGVYYSGCTSLQKKAGIQDSKEEWKKYIRATGEGYENSNLMEVWVEKAPENLDWLIKLGVDFPLKNIYMSGNEGALSSITKPVPRGYITKEQSGSSISKALYNEAVRLGVKFSFNTTAQKLLTNQKSEIIGVSTNKGNLKAKQGVVIASAGFSRNKEWIKSFKPDLLNGGSFGSSRQNGDGIRMAMDLGANIANMWITQADTIGTKISESMWPCMVIAIWGLPCIFVSSDGKRHVPEDMYYEYQSKEIAKQNGGFVWSIWDQSVTDRGSESITVPACSKNCELEIKNGYFKKADTIEELAKKINIDPNVLNKTVEKYNEMMEKGVDNQLGRKKGLGKVNNGPFYAAKTTPATCDTAGGLCIDDNSQVLDVWNKPIPKLYAAGSTTSGWRGKIYQGSGTAISIAVTFGRIAGKSVSQKESKKES